MSPDPCEAFNEWCELEGLETRPQISKTIGVGVSSINYWKTGERSPPKNVLLACAAVTYNLRPMESIMEADAVRFWAADRKLNYKQAGEAWGVSESTFKAFANAHKGRKANLTIQLAAAAATWGIPPINHQKGDPVRKWPKAPISERPEDERYSNPGSSRARNMTPDERSEAARHAAQIRWAKEKNPVEKKPKIVVK